MLFIHLLNKIRGVLGMKTVACAIILGLFFVGTSFAADKGNVTKVVKINPKEIKLDRDYDGKIDRTEFYDANGVIVRTETDVDGNGVIDEIVYYKAGSPVKGEKDVDNDGNMETTLFYDADGVLFKTELDKNKDGKSDETVYYEKGKPVKAEKDLNTDGKLDTWVTY